MSPYRSDGADRRAEPPRDPGIVGEVVAQFADPFAFLRELVQNAIDAGTAEIEVALTHDAAAGVLHVSVRDRGEGMTRDIVENQLLVLFRSTKERDPTKIGKFGIGFASVLAPGPRIVIVHTARDGRRLTLHLYADLTYQLFDAGAAAHSGTTVTLELAHDAAAAAGFVERSRAALVTWCRHTAVPLRLTAEVPEAGVRLAVRIDRPLALEDAVLEIRGEADGGQLIAVVGIVPANAPPYAGWFNRGLLLYETAEPVFGRLAVKLEDPRLGHTLSRDNVRRDARFEHAVAFARELAAERLPAAAAVALRAAAAAGAGRGSGALSPGSGGDPEAAPGVRDPASSDGAPTALADLRYHALAQAIDAAGVELPAADWAVPLVEPIGGARWLAVAALGRRAWTAPDASELTRALAAAGVPVIRADRYQTLGVADRARSHGCRVAALLDEVTGVATIEPSARDAALTAALAAVLAAVHRAPSAIALGWLTGAGATALAVTGGPRDAVHPPTARGTYVLDHETAKRSPFGLLRRPPLVLAIGHPLVAAARTADPPIAAAAHLARAILLHYRALDRDRSDAIFTYTLEHLGLVSS